MNGSTKLNRASSGSSSLSSSHPVLTNSKLSVARDVKKARQLWQQAVNQMDTDAMALLGEQFQLEGNFAKAKLLFERSIANTNSGGSGQTQAIHRLGRMYGEGEGVKVGAVSYTWRSGAYVFFVGCVGVPCSLP